MSLKKWKVIETKKSFFEKPSKKSFSRKNHGQKSFFAQELLKNYFLTLSPYIPFFNAYAYALFILLYYLLYEISIYNNNYYVFIIFMLIYLELLL